MWNLQTLNFRMFNKDMLKLWKVCDSKMSSARQGTPTRHWRDSRSRENLERKWSIFFISSWRIEFSFLKMLSNVKILKKKFSFSSRNSRFWKKFSFTSRKNEILQTDSLSLLDSSLNVFSNSREKSYFALWVDFDHQCFAERESILKRQFCEEVGDEDVKEFDMDGEREMRRRSRDGFLLYLIL